MLFILGEFVNSRSSPIERTILVPSYLGPSIKTLQPIEVPSHSRDESVCLDHWSNEVDEWIERVFGTLSKIELAKKETITSQEGGHQRARSGPGEIESGDPADECAAGTRQGLAGD